MKKRILFLVVLSVFMVLSVFLLADLHSYDPSSKPLPEADNGIVFSITTFDGESESAPFVPCLGHTWLSLENRSGHPVYLKDYPIAEGETLTFSIWAITGHRGVYFNLEPHFIAQYGRYVGRRSLSVTIREEQLSVVEAYLEENDTWTLTNNCSRFSLELWNRVAGEPYHLKTQTLLYTPKRLLSSFSEFNQEEENRDFPGVKNIFYYRDGIRTELELCA